MNTILFSGIRQGSADPGLLLKVQTKWTVTICMLRSRCSTKKWAGTHSLVVRTRETLQRLGFEDIAADLAAHNLPPA